MYDEILARVLLMPDGSIHIAHKNKQAYYCTAEALMLLLNGSENFVLNGRGILVASTALVNKRQDDIALVRGLTLLTVKINAEITCGFPILFKMLFSSLSDLSKFRTCMRITKDVLQDSECCYNNPAIFLYLEHCKLCDTLKATNKSLTSFYFEPTAIMLEEILKLPDFSGSVYSFDEITESFINNLVEETPTKPNENAAEDSPEIQTEDVEPEEAIIKQPKSATPVKYVTVAEYVKTHGLKTSTVNSWLWHGKLSSAYKDENNKWMIDVNDTNVQDGRKGRKSIPMPDGRKRVRLKGTDYESVQLYIKDRNLVTDNIRPFIRAKEEIRYYETHNYHEVSWSTGNAMIIDINPDYFSKKHGKTNRQLIADSKAPVVPNNEDVEYVLHHIGQNLNSPLAIIPANDHADPVLSAALHLGKTSSEDLHGADFNKQKRQFWNKYIEMYDQNGGYKGIQYLNQKCKRKVVQ